jgi:hypothetical protein
MYNYLQSSSCCLYCNACYEGEERLRNVKFLLGKMDPHNVAVYKNLTTLNEDLWVVSNVPSKPGMQVRKQHLGWLG